jgi:hypothetical protein
MVRATGFIARSRKKKTDRSDGDVPFAGPFVNMVFTGLSGARLRYQSGAHNAGHKRNKIWLG